MDDEVEISSGTDTDEDGALIEKARQAAEQKRVPPKKRGPTSTAPSAMPHQIACCMRHQAALQQTLRMLCWSFFGLCLAIAATRRNS